MFIVRLTITFPKRSRRENHYEQANGIQEGNEHFVRKD